MVRSMSAPSRRLSILLINPRFRPSYWGRDHALPLQPGDKRAWTMGGALPLLAALTPAGHDVRLIDESVEVIDFDRLDDYDIIGLTGMIVQRDRMKEILQRLRPLPGLVVVGGPYASIDEAFFDGLCDALFVGEAEQTWPGFVGDVALGRPIRRRYEQAEPTDMALVPKPRIELLKSHHYMSASMQFSRGCPFRCEFCDIIVLFGRRPRVKTADQMLAELDDIRQTGLNICFIVDDNFIGNKPAVMRLLPEIIRWQERHGYPLVFSTEATLNLADDPDLMAMMVKANFREVFIGLESPRPASLQETRKTQNLAGDGMAAKLDRIRDAGLVVAAGFIVGFDADDDRIFAEQYDFIADNALAQVSLGILMALPRTPLYDRLRDEGRIIEDGHACNYLPRQMSRDALTDGCAALLRDLYEPEAFFSRLYDNIDRSPSFQEHRARMVARSAGAPSRFGDWLAQWRNLVTMTGRLSRALHRAGMLREIGLRYARIRFAAKKGSRRHLPLPTFISLCTLHWHHYRLTHLSVEDGARAVNIYDAAPVEADPPQTGLSVRESTTPKSAINAEIVES